MHFEWDEDKALRNLEKHGVDFELAKLIFDGPVSEAPDKRIHYGEDRIIAIGTVGEVGVVVVYTWRGKARRLISARRANGQERKAYRQAFHE